MLRSRTLIKAAVFGVFYFPVNCPMQAADSRVNLTPSLLDINVQANAFGAASSADITAVLRSAASELWRYCPGTQLGAIDVYYRADHPQLDFERTPSGHIGIGLSARDTRWSQYSFQFAHEFCHALANYSNNPGRFARRPPQANLWLEESLCETASLFTLRAMSRSWLAAPPYAAWQSYAPWLNDYVEQRLAQPEHQLPVGTSFLSWFQAHYSALRQNAAIRDWNTIIAIQLLPIFETEPRGWETLTFLNRGPFDANESLAEHLNEWHSRCPGDFRPFITRLAAVFAVKL